MIENELFKEKKEKTQKKITLWETQEKQINFKNVKSYKYKNTIHIGYNALTPIAWNVQRIKFWGKLFPKWFIWNLNT